MLKQYNVEIIQDVDFADLEYPHELLTHDEDGSHHGLSSNHNYHDIRNYFDWDDWQEVYDIESEIFTRFNNDTTDPEEVESALETILDEQEDILHRFYGELGVMSITTALSAIGYAPFTGCRGHAHREDAMPHVAFFAKDAKPLYEIVKEHPNIALVSFQFMEGMGLNMYAKNNLDLIEFSKVLSESNLWD